MKTVDKMARYYKTWICNRIYSSYYPTFGKHNAVQSVTRKVKCARNISNIHNKLSDFGNVQKVNFHGSNITFTRGINDNKNGGRNNKKYQKGIIAASMMAVLGLGIYHFNRTECKEDHPIDLHNKRERAREILMKIKDEYGCPGVVVCVSVDGRVIWSEGIGYSNVENQVPCTPNSVMRIASISKPLTVAILAKLWEEGKLDLDKPVQEYVKEWPDKLYDGEKVTITTRHLLSHLAGIRHYDKTAWKKTPSTKSQNEPADKSGISDKSKKEKKNFVEKVENTSDKNTNITKDDKKVVSGFEQKELFLKRHFPNTSTSLELFKNDELCSKPGTQFLYSTHGYTLLSAVIEAVSGKNFTTLAKRLFTELGLENTFLDEYAPIIYNRSSYYIKSKNGKLLNAPYVDLSYKWAGGGFLSTVEDIVKFGNAMLYSYQQNSVTKNQPKGYLKPETVKMLWSPISHTGWDEDSGWYGMGWGVMPEVKRYAFGKERPFCVSHTGGAVGASSVILIMPTDCKTTSYQNRIKSLPSNEKKSQEIIADGRNQFQQGNEALPHGVVVGIIVNMQSVGLNTAALKIANIFAD